MHDCDCPLSATYCDKLNRFMTPALVKFCKETPSHRGRLYREPKPEPKPVPNPESLKHEHKPNPNWKAHSYPLDIWALGANLFLMLTGERTFLKAEP